MPWLKNPGIFQIKKMDCGRSKRQKISLQNNIVVTLSNRSADIRGGLRPGVAGAAGNGGPGKA
jgi:hypothetical protein